MKRTTIILLTLCALLCGCTKEQREAPPVTDESDAHTFAPELLPEKEDADEWTLADFSGCFDGERKTAREERALDEGLSVTVLYGEEDGPAVYVVAGVHGDEIAGWRAGNLLKNACLRAGALYIISPANAYGAANDQRKTAEERDLNRNFPGDEDGCDAARIAAEIFSDIAQRQPALLLDLHEAHEASDNGADALGNSLICDASGETGDAACIRERDAVRVSADAVRFAAAWQHKPHGVGTVGHSGHHSGNAADGGSRAARAQPVGDRAVRFTG